MAFYGDVRGPSHFDSDPDDCDLVYMYADFVYAVARQEFLCSVGYVDSDDLAQESLLKLHLIPQKETINCPRSYIRQLVHRQAIDMRRKDKAHQLIVTDDEGELQQGKAIVSMSEEYANPEDILIEKEKLKEALAVVVEVLGKLQPRQKLAAACTLHSRTDMPELQEYLFTIGSGSPAIWPESAAEKQKLQSSYAPVRKKFAAKFGVELKKRRKRSR